MKIITKNKKAYFNYFIEDEFNAGIELKGVEVKSVKMGKLSINESFVRVIKNEIFIMGMSISNYPFANIYNVEENRVRKLLLNRKEINKISEKVKLDGYTIIPLNVYSIKNLIKVKIALAKGKKNYDKRETIKNRDIERNISKNFKNSY